MIVENVFAYWRFPPWMWAMAVGSFVVYWGWVINRYR